MTKKNIITMRPLCEIACEIRKDWKTPFYGAVEYINAMMCLNKLTDTYGFDSGRSIVTYFLSNASSWKGEVARNIKKELNAMLKFRG